MQTIRCAACGRRYDYRQEGCCPHCGAYNRPPRREWVEADGSIRRAEDQRTAQPKPGKVCYEEKQCFEEQTRKSRKKQQARSAPAGQQIPRSFQGRSYARRGQNNSTGATVFAIVLVVAIIIIKTVVTGNQTWNGDWIPEDESENQIYEKIIEGTCREKLQIRDDLSIQVLGYSADDEGQVYLFYLTDNPDASQTLLEDGFISLESRDEMYFSSELEDGYIVFDTYTTDEQWQTLHIESHGYQINVYDLATIES